MKKQTALVLSTLVLLSAVSIQPANAFKCKLKFWEKETKSAVEAPVKKEVAPAPAVVKKEVATPVAKTTPAVKPVCNCQKPAAPAVKPVAAKTPVKAPVAKAPVKK